ncbi:protein kinase [Microbacterium sp. QXD-8]|uniref:non-specific serine/threonine protein kinase n=1 Tax=Microbacterium psychrotolerans TaxID=3068321 RepID=A0ABU0Z0H3_9MICO|nr:protein kinase [Microbacterium sp. QXD-8]MDQ7877518.1 protein kinase [Microbacterium sp. QXD-8]
MSTPTALVADRYRLVKMLGAGGMGIVWQAWDSLLRRPVALKMLRTQPELTDQERQVATDRAMREARITAGLHHPHAVTVFDVVEHDGQPCIVMQLIESTPLSELLREHGTFTPAETARIGAEVASALAAAHALKIVHRDVKPGNILVASDGSALISDFGISHALGDTTITATGIVHGTPAFLAPEVARGLPTSFASDVFSLGSTLYAMVEGGPPFGTDRNSIALLHRVARGGYPPPKHAGPLTPILRKMLAPQPKRRPAMEWVVEALGSVQRESAADQAVSAGLLALGFDEATAGWVGESKAETAAQDTATPPMVPADVSPEDEYESEDARDEDARPVPRTPPTIPADLGPEDESETAPRTPADSATARLPTGKTVPVDQPTRYEAPTAETEPLRPSAPASATVGRVGEAPSWTTEASPAEPRPARRRRRAGVIAAALIVLVALGIGATLLFTLQRPRAQPDADPTAAPTSSSTPVEESAEPETVPPVPATSAPPEEETEPDPVPVSSEQRVVDTISGYYAMMPDNRDGAWPLMTADYQENHAGGRGGYEEFWAAISDVSIADVTATGPDSGQATLTYYFRDGRVVEEVTAYRLTDEAGVLKIAATEVLSSR